MNIVERYKVLKPGLRLVKDGTGISGTDESTTGYKAVDRDGKDMIDSNGEKVRISYRVRHCGLNPQWYFFAEKQNWFATTEKDILILLRNVYRISYMMRKLKETADLSDFEAAVPEYCT